MKPGLAPLVVFFVALLQVSCAPVYYSGPISDHFDGQQFFYPKAAKEKKRKSALRWMLTRKRPQWPAFHDLAVTDVPPARVNGDHMRVSYVGHSSVLVQTRGLNILFDPVWANRASPVFWAGPKRVLSPGIRLADLPPLDAVLISHNHYDHLDLYTLEQLLKRHQPRIFVPLGNESIILKRLPTARVESMDWGEERKLGPDFSVHCEPVAHWSARNPWDRNRALWAGFVLTAPGGNLYFAGDSGCASGIPFRDTQKKFGNFRFACLPIGAYEPRWFMAAHHMNPEESIAVFEQLGRPYSLAIHHGVFQLADDQYEAPVKALQLGLRDDPEGRQRFRALRPGEHWWIP